MRPYAQYTVDSVFRVTGARQQIRRGAAKVPNYGSQDREGRPRTREESRTYPLLYLDGSGSGAGQWTSTTIMESPQLGGLIIAGNAQGDRAFGLFEKAALEQP